MSNKGNKYKVGLLTIVSLILLIVILISLGILSTFKTKYRFMTIISTSVQGLERGAKVKFKGVTIGKVESIQISRDGGNIFIFMEMNPQAVADKMFKLERTGHSLSKQEQFKNFLEDRIKNGARCQLRYGGITGNLYIEIGVYDPKKYPIIEYPLPENHPPYLPAIPPVLIGNIMKTLQDALEHIAAIDINKIVQDIEVTMVNVNKTLNDINQGIKDAQISKLSDSLNGFLNTSEDTMGEILELRKSIDVALQNANDVMNSAQSLIQYLEEHPASLIHGRQDESVIEP
jgi:paraquat-inducible protein B